MFHLIDVKTGKEIDDLPKIKEFYEPTKLQKGVDLIKYYFDKKNLRMKYISYTECLRKNCKIISYPLKPRMTPMYPGQIDYYDLVHESELKNLGPRYILLNECPDKVLIKFDILYNRIKIVGKGCGWKKNRYQRPWLYIDDYENIKEEKK